MENIQEPYNKTTRQAFYDNCTSCTKLFIIKNDEYGESFKACGILGVAVELIGLAARLFQLVLRNPTHGRDRVDQLRNVFMDAHNYGNMGLILLDEENWEGKR